MPASEWVVYLCGCAGNEMIGKLLKMQMLEDDDELAYTPAETDEAMKREADGRPGWMRILSSDLLDWSKMLPKVRACLTISRHCIRFGF